MKKFYNVCVETRFLTQIIATPQRGDKVLVCLKNIRPIKSGFVEFKGLRDGKAYRYAKTPNGCFVTLNEWEKSVYCIYDERKVNDA